MSMIPQLPEQLLDLHHSLLLKAGPVTLPFLDPRPRHRACFHGARPLSAGPEATGVWFKESLSDQTSSVVETETQQAYWWATVYGASRSRVRRGGTHRLLPGGSCVCLALTPYISSLWHRDDDNLLRGIFLKVTGSASKTSGTHGVQGMLSTRSVCPNTVVINILEKIDLQ